MKKQPLFLEPVFQERIWGGKKLQTEFGYSIPSQQTGECWAVSAHPNGQSIVKNGPLVGKSLSQLWDEDRSLFGNVEGGVFPLLTKVLDASNDLSVQVHPDDEYAAKYENGELGKTECWYVIDCEEGSEIIFGHHAKTKEEFVDMIEKGLWDQLLRRVQVQPGDFFYVPSGTIHALGAGVLILETQQSSDTTYRVYDYERVGEDGQKRELHIGKSIDVSTVPHRNVDIDQGVHAVDGAKLTTFVREKYFSVYKWEISSSLTYEVKEPFLICSVIEGDGTIKTPGDTHSLKKGDHFILPNDIGSVEVSGPLSLIVSHP